MLQIERVSWLKQRYVVRDGAGHTGMWARRRFSEIMTGEVDGERYELQRDGRQHFVLEGSRGVLARADAGARGRWTISAGAGDYELRPRSSWRSEMVLLSGESTVGSIRKGRAPRGTVLCDLPSELSPAVQAFIGFLVLTLWNRAAASSAAATAAVSGSGG